MKNKGLIIAMIAMVSVVGLWSIVKSYSGVEAPTYLAEGDMYVSAEAPVDTLGASVYTREITFAEGIIANGDFNADSNTLFVDASTDRVGIGTSTPEVTLHIDNSGATTTIQVGSNGTAGQGSCFEIEAGDGTKLYLSATSTFSAASPWTGLLLSTTACN